MVLVLKSLLSNVLTAAAALFEVRLNKVPKSEDIGNNNCLLFVVAISFLVLIERFLLRLAQVRVGCRVTRWFRLMQTLVDRRKLFTKSNRVRQLVVRFCFFLSAYITLYFSFTNFYQVLFCLGITTLCMYMVCFMNLNMLSFIANIRVVLMSVSFDVVFSFFLLVRMFLLFTNNYVTLLLFVTICLMELRRTPYDLIERESELVSRYNIEYRGFRFVYLFLREYLRFFWILVLMRKIFLVKMMFLNLMLLALVMIRAVLPRLKFNQVLTSAWRIINMIIFLRFLF